MAVTLYIEGMMCPHCENAVKTALEAIGGDGSAAVDHKAGTAVVSLTGDTDKKVLIDAVTAKGYKVTDCK